MNLKLNNKRTILVGLAFLSICAFWQMYNSVIPKILTYTFHLDETYSGIIMAADNVLALFLLPLFGAISDKSRSRMGRRMPFILCGTGCAVLLMMLLPILDNSYAASPSVTKLVLFIAVLGLLLIAMGTYRSPAVALMPDVTPKPLRSRANAIINLMGAVGGILYLVITSVLYSSSRVAGLEHVNYLPLFAIVAGIMAVSVGILFAAIREKKLHEENMALEAEHPEWNLAEVDESGNEKLPSAVRRSLGFLLASIALWFIGYNAIETWFTTFADKMWGMALGDATDLDGEALLSLAPESLASVLQVSGVDPHLTEYIARSLMLSGRYHGEAGRADMAELRRAQGRAVAAAFGHELGSDPVSDEALEALMTASDGEA